MELHVREIHQGADAGTRRFISYRKMNSQEFFLVPSGLREEKCGIKVAEGTREEGRRKGEGRGDGGGGWQHPQKLARKSEGLPRKVCGDALSKRQSRALGVRQPKQSRILAPKKKKNLKNQKDEGNG